jgi:predicted RNA binding protein YcfA (HicA-like mRNA interferase family)
MLINDRHPNPVVVPVHGAKPLPRGTLASIIRIAGVGKKTFFAALK